MLGWYARSTNILHSNAKHGLLSQMSKQRSTDLSLFSDPYCISLCDLTGLTPV